MLQTVLDTSCAPSVQGCFHVAAQQPVLYTVQESLNLLALDNMVSQLCKCLRIHARYVTMHLFKVLLHVLLLVWCSTLVCSYCCLDCYTDGSCFFSVMCANLEFDI